MCQEELIMRLVFALSFLFFYVPTFGCEKTAIAFASSTVTATVATAVAITVVVSAVCIGSNTAVVVLLFFFLLLFFVLLAFGL